MRFSFHGPRMPVKTQKMCVTCVKNRDLTGTLTDRAKFLPWECKRNLGYLMSDFSVRLCCIEGSSAVGFAFGKNRARDRFAFG